MLLLILLALGIILIIYQIFFVKKIYRFILNTQGEKDKPALRESEAYNNLFKAKLIYYSIYIIFLLISIFLGRHLELKAWLLVFYAEWGLGFLFIMLNFKFLNHYLNVKFVIEALDVVEKEFVIGSIRNDNYIYVLSYRLLNKKINI